MRDPIERQDAIDALDCINGVEEVLRSLPSAQPERLTDDDFETIRIHLNSYKEKLCNLQRWEEAEEYQRIIDRFMAFASAQPKILACGEGELSAQPDSDMIHLQKEQAYMQGYEDGQAALREELWERERERREE